MTTHNRDIAYLKGQLDILSMLFFNCENGITFSPREAAAYADLFAEMKKRLSFDEEDIKS